MTVRPSTPANERSLAELLNERSILNGQIRDLEKRSADEQNDADLGCEDARHRAAALQAEMGDVIERRRNLQVVIDATQQRVKLAEMQKAAGEEAARPYDLAKACHERIQLAAQAQSQIEALGDTLREMQKNGVRIMQLDGTNEARRLYGLGSFKHRVVRAFAKQLVAIPSSDAAPISGFGVMFLDFELPIKGAAAYDKTLAELEAETLDHLPLNIFRTQAHAEAARKRRDPSGLRLHVKPHGDYFVLVAGELRGVAAQKRAS